MKGGVFKILSVGMMVCGLTSSTTIYRANRFQTFQLPDFIHDTHRVAPNGEGFFIASEANDTIHLSVFDNNHTKENEIKIYQNDSNSLWPQTLDSDGYGTYYLGVGVNPPLDGVCPFLFLTGNTTNFHNVSAYKLNGTLYSAADSVVSPDGNITFAGASEGPQKRPVVTQIANRSSAWTSLFKFNFSSEAIAIDLMMGNDSFSVFGKGQSGMISNTSNDLFFAEIDNLGMSSGVSFFFGSQGEDDLFAARKDPIGNQVFLWETNGTGISPMGGYVLGKVLYGGTLGWQRRFCAPKEFRFTKLDVDAQGIYVIAMVGNYSSNSIGLFGINHGGNMTLSAAFNRSDLKPKAQDLSFLDNGFVVVVGKEQGKSMVVTLLADDVELCGIPYDFNVTLKDDVMPLMKNVTLDVETSTSKLSPINVSVIPTLSNTTIECEEDKSITMNPTEYPTVGPTQHLQGVVLNGDYPKNKDSSDSKDFYEVFLGSNPKEEEKIGLVIGVIAVGLLVVGFIVGGIYMLYCKKIPRKFELVKENTVQMSKGGITDV